MSFIDLNLQTLNELFAALCTTGQIPHHVEESLMVFRTDPGYLVCLLDLVLSTQNIDIQFRAAIEFKNTVVLHWVPSAHARTSRKKTATTQSTRKRSAESCRL